jgi:hypothetical protein
LAVHPVLGAVMFSCAVPLMFTWPIVTGEPPLLFVRMIVHPLQVTFAWAPKETLPPSTT